MTRRKENPRWGNRRPDVGADEVARRYRNGQSGPEIAAALGCATRTVFSRLAKAGVPVRERGKFKRFPSGHGWAWKGKAATYSVKHRRVARLRGQPQECSECGRTDDAVVYDWANLNGDYDDPYDYRRMCRPCHKRFDLKRLRDAA